MHADQGKLTRSTHNAGELVAFWFLQDFGPQVSTKPAAVPCTARPLVGKYVRLEGLCKEHIPSLFSNLGLPQDKSVFDWLPWTDPTTTEDELWDLFERLRKNRGFIIYAIKADAQYLSARQLDVLGTIGYLDIQPQHRALEVGAVLFSPALRRSAAATEAHYLLLRHASEPSDSLPYRRIAWKCNHLNTASRRAAERIGYVYEGTFRKHMIAKGYSRDSDLLSIVDDEWATIKKAFETWLEERNFDEQGRQLRTLQEIRADISK